MEKEIINANTVTWNKFGWSGG